MAKNERSGATPRRRLAQCAAATALMLTPPLVACAASPPEPINPCTLLTVAEVSAVLGETPESGRYFDNGLTNEGAYSTTCLWAAPLAPGVSPDTTKPLGGRGFAILNVMNWPAPADSRKFLDSFTKAFEDHEITSKPVGVNVGADDAIWWGDGVAARKNGVSFGVSVAHVGDRAERKPKAEQLAARITQRLAGRPGG